MIPNIIEIGKALVFSYDILTKHHMYMWYNSMYSVLYLYIDWKPTSTKICIIYSKNVLNHAERNTSQIGLHIQPGHINLHFKPFLFAFRVHPFMYNIAALRFAMNGDVDNIRIEFYDYYITVFFLWMVTTILIYWLNH